MSFHPGQLVVCVNVSGFDYANAWAPRLGRVYTVSEFGQPDPAFAVVFLRGGAGIRLEEGDTALPKRERWFSACRFRPLADDRIASLRAHLATPPRQKVSA